MGLFTSRKKEEEKIDAKFQQWLKENHLDEINPAYFDDLKQARFYINSTFAVSGGVLTPTDDNSLLTQISSLEAGIAQQNLILIKQNNEIIEQLKKLNAE